MRICMLLHKSVEHDSRVRREAKALAAAGHEVTVVHLPSERHGDELRLDGFRVVCATPRSWVRHLLPFHAYRLAFLAAFVRETVRARPDVVHAHDAPMLAPGLLAARLARAKLVYDSHELATGVPYRERFWAYLVAGLERIALPRCAAVITVSDGIADRLRELYGLRQRPVVLRNVPDVEAAAEGSAGLRERLGIGSAPLVLHQGALAPRRGCMTLVDAVSRLAGAHLVFLGDAWPGYDGLVEEHARSTGIADRVHFVPSVPLAELARHTREADVGVSLLSDDCENHRLALPNKVFEYIAAGVPVVVSDLPELRHLVGDYGVGWTVDGRDPSKLADVLSVALNDDNGRAEAVARAAGTLTWASEQRHLLDLYGQLGVDAGGTGQRALVLVRNPVTHDARVLREARVLHELGYDTTVIGVASTGDNRVKDEIAGVQVVRLGLASWPARLRRLNGQRRGASAAEATGRPAEPRPPVARRTVRRLLVTLDWYRRGIAVVRRSRPALVHCNDYNTMWIGVAASLLGSKVVYDAHELWPDRNLRPEPRGWLLLCESLFVRVADRVITTSPGYSKLMAHRYRISPPVVIRNVPHGVPSASQLPEAGPWTAVYFGALTRSRGLEQTIRAVRHVPDLHLRLVGPDAWGFRNELRALIEELGVDDRVDLLDPVAPGDASQVMRDAALGLALIQPACLSYELTLPNKLFEYLYGGLPILGTALPMIEQFIHSHGVGLTVAPGCDEETLAEALRKMLDPTLNRRFRAAGLAAAAGLTWTGERRRLIEVYGTPAETG